MSAATMMVGWVFFGASAGWAQQTAGATAKQLVGTWAYVTSESLLPDGSRRLPFGTDGKGILMFDANGRFSQQIVSSNRPKFAANNRLKGTPEEYKAAVHGSIGNFGTYTVDEAGKVIIFRVEGSTFPNSDGETQKRPILSLTRDELKYRTAGTTGAPTDATWRRVK